LGRAKKVGSAGRYGARFGVTIRKRIVEIESQAKRKHLCPSCQSRAVKRVSVGIWRCRRCGHTFAGGAVLPTTKIGDVARRSASGALSSAKAKQEKS
jgi:large subunit ribosomal protein L37Ae